MGLVAGPGKQSIDKYTAMKGILRFFFFGLILIGLLFFIPSLRAQQETKSLAKKSQNPLSDLLSLPLQNNMTFPVEPNADVQNELEIEPIIPLIMGPISMINQVVLPIVIQPEMVPGGSSAAGLGDINYQFLISLARSNKVFGGLGALIVFPTASNSLTGQGKFSLGPSFGFQTDLGPWVGGLLVNNVWSVAGDDSRPGVNQMQLNPTLNFNFNHGWFLTSTPSLTANWKAPNNNRWVVPVGGGGGKVFYLGGQAINLNTQFFFNAIRPQGSGKFTWFLNFQFLFPHKI
jgi:hypothetical protein